MSLTQTILNYLQEFSNINNEIRSKAEQDINFLLSQNSIETINSLFEIINNNPSTKEAYYSAILIRNYLNLEKLNSVLNNSPDLFTHIKNILLKLTSDSRFPQNLNMFLISELLVNFFAVTICNKKNLFNEFIPFLITLLDNNKFRSNSLQNLFSSLFQFDDLQTYYPQIIEKCDLFTQDFDYRSNSFCFYLSCVKFDSFNFQSFFQNIANQMPQIFDDMPDKQFTECTSTAFLMYNGYNFNIVSRFFPFFFKFIIPRLLDINRNELTKVNFVNDITHMLSSTFFFDFISQNELGSKLLEIICMFTSNPIQYPDLYNECQIMIKKLYNDYFINNQIGIKNNPHRYHFFQSLKQIENFPNLFVSSLISKVFIDGSNLKRAIEYASIQDDPNYSRIIIRRNGLSQIKKIITNSMENELKIELFDILINLYKSFRDEKIMNVITNLSHILPEEVIIMKRNVIISLCNEQITKSIICCATIYCVNIEQNTESILFSRFLFQATINLVSNDKYSLAEILSSLAQIIKIAGPETIYAFINQTMPIIIDDPNCFTNKPLKYFIKYIEKNNKDHNFSKLIFTKLIEFIQSMNSNDLIIIENITHICYAIKMIPFYAKYIEFTNDLLNHIISLLIKQTSETDIRIKGKAIKTISKLSKYYYNNMQILPQILNLFHDLYQHNNDVYVARQAINLILQIILTVLQMQPEANIDQFILLYPLLFERFYIITLSICQRDKVIDQITTIDISIAIRNLLCLFNNFLQKNPQLITKLILDLFIRNEQNNQIGWRFGLPFFTPYFVQLWCNFLILVRIELYSNELPKIIQLLINTAFDPDFNDIKTKTNAVVALSAFFCQNEMQITLINSFINNELIPLINSSKNDDSPESSLLLNHSLFSLIGFLTKYTQKGIYFISILRIVIENINYISIANSFNFESLFLLINLCLSSPETAQLSQILISKAIDLVQNNRVELKGLITVYTNLHNTPQMPNVLQPLYQVISQIITQFSNHS